MTALRRYVLACALLTVAIMAPAKPASGASTFSAVADAELSRIVITSDPPVVAAELFDPGVVASQAKVSSVGESTAFASDPYPGAILTTATALANYLLSSTIPDAPIPALPPYPFYAASSFPLTPSASVDTPPLSLEARSAAVSSEGVARDSANRSVAHVEVDPGTDVVTAQATTELGAVDAGPLLRIDGVRSAARAVRRPSGDLERSTEFSAASVTVLGQTLRLTPSGLELATANVPLDLTKQLSPVDQLLAELAKQGIGLRFLPSTDTPDGVISGGLEVSVTVPNPSNQGSVIATITYGRTLASVSNTARPVGSHTSASPLASPSGSGQAGTSFVPAAPAGGGFASTPPSLGSVAQPAAGETVQSVAGQSVRALVPDQTHAGRFYPVLLVVGLFVVGSFTIFRKLGEGMAWSS